MSPRLRLDESPSAADVSAVGSAGVAEVSARRRDRRASAVTAGVTAGVAGALLTDAAITDVLGSATVAATAAGVEVESLPAEDAMDWSVVAAAELVLATVTTADATGEADDELERRLALEEAAPADEEAPIPAPPKSDAIPSPPPRTNCPPLLTVTTPLLEVAPRSLTTRVFPETVVPPL